MTAKKMRKSHSSTTATAVFTRRTVLVLICVLILVSIALRYPRVEHERLQTDSYFIHTLAQSIVDYDQAKWTYNVFSYFGQFPLSYPSGVPFILAEMSELTGLTVEVCILLLDIMLSIIFCLAVFCLSREFVSLSQYALLATFFAILGPRFVDTTYWDASARGAGVVLIILLVFLLFRSGLLSSRGYWILAILIGFTCFTVHRISVFIILFGLAYAMAVPCYRYVRLNSLSRKRRYVVAGFMALGAGVMLLTLSVFEMLGLSVETSFSDTGRFPWGPPVLTVVLNAGVSYAHQIGFIILPAAIGLVAVFRRSSLSLKAIYPAAVILAFLPVVGNSLYVSMVILPFVSVLGVMWLATVIRKSTSKRMVAIGLVLLTTSSVVLTVWSVDRWNDWEVREGGRVEVDPRVFSDATYLDANAGGMYAVASQDMLFVQFAATTDLVFIRSGINSVLTGDVSEEDVEANTELSREKFPKTLYSWFTYTDYYFIDIFVWSLMTFGVGFPGDLPWTSGKTTDYANTHSHLYVIVDNRYPGEYSDPNGEYASKYLLQLRNATTSGTDPEFSYLVYQSQGISVFLVRLDV